MALPHPRTGPLVLAMLMVWSMVIYMPMRANASLSSAPHIILSSTDSISLDGAFEVMPDPSGEASLTDVITQHDQFILQPDGLHEGYTTSAYWLRITVHRTPSAPERWYLEITPPLLDEITLYMPDARDQTGYSARTLGDAQNFKERFIEHQNFIFPIRLEPDKPTTLYIRLKTTGIMTVNAWLQTPERYASLALQEHLILGMGAWLLVGIANMLIGLTARPRGFHWWVIYLFAEGLHALASTGLAFPFIAPNHPALAAAIPGMALGLGSFAIARLLIELFELRCVFPRLANQLRRGSWLGILGGSLPFFSVVALSLLQLMYGSLLLLALVLSVHGALIRKSKACYSYFAGFAVLNLFFALTMTRNLGLIEPSFVVNHLWQLNVLIHVLLTNYGFYLALSNTREQRRESRTQLAAAKLNRQFISMVSHELLTPLSTIRTGLANMQGANRGDEEERLRRHDRLMRASQRMRMLIDNYLADGNLQTDNFRMVRARLEMNAWLPAMLEDGGWNTRATRVRLETDEGGVVVLADPHLLRMAVSNLVDNALKYSSHDSPVTVRTRSESDKAFIHVQDHGSGIEPNDVSKIFNPYFRSENRPAAYGTGLGLFIVKQIVELHGGTVTVETEVGRGSTFTITLDLLKELV